MPEPKHWVFEFSDDQAAYVDGLVRSGRYSSSHEVLRAGLIALQERDSATDERLRRGVVPVMRAMQADRTLGIPGQSVFDEIRTLHARRIKTV